MTNGNDSAYASAPFKYGDNGEPLHIGKQANQGLTKREYMATAIAQGMFANPALSERAFEAGEDVGIDVAAVHFADKLIAALNDGQRCGKCSSVMPLGSKFCGDCGEGLADNGEKQS